MTWKYFHGNCEDTSNPLAALPDRPPWREFLPLEAVDQELDAQYWRALRAEAQENQRMLDRGRTFRIQTDGQAERKGYSEIIDAVNAAIHLRRPLLVTGAPGSGKTSLAYAIAYELQLGPVLTWPITARSNLMDALYRYDAIARLQDAQLDKTRQGNAQASAAVSEEGDLGDYIHLGPVGTAFIPSRLPRVLLIDEIDKSDLNLPNDLLNLFEEGEFEIPELVRRKRHKGGVRVSEAAVTVRTADRDMDVPITNGRVKCCEFPIVLMTSNGERDFPPAFYRRCLRVTMPNPTPASLLPIVRSHFDQVDQNGWTQAEENLKTLIAQFLDKGNKADRATDQLLNAIYLMTRQESPSEQEMEGLQKLLFKRLSELG
ncbi:AAA family ATPase [Leptothoe spongobia]|uniref:AAA family ATPase n=1 Tax=Leptothoe spongobia TAU-MAC 1115 TaxID=1967444 RepID=A0A947GKD9_9CYAN|nr:AAA family ATPase [Leptothoe spongobia]MBT9317304.1 AAA family ATPase [Leptothoe spongobia TAU-MAC 1115]